MFIPIDTIYNPKSQYVRTKRVLTKIPDTCKWKESSDITIDFKIKRVANNLIELYVYDPSSDIKDDKNLFANDVQFVGSNRYPLTSEMIDHEHSKTKDLPSGQIVEYEWIWFDGSGILQPRKVRYDKHGANREQVALDDWEDIMDPITDKEIRGENTKMVDRFFNKIKFTLYKQISEPDGANLLDIGAGKGGDVSKWEVLRKNDDTGYVVAVEPHDDNREELEFRVNNNDAMRGGVEIVGVGGENTITITEVVNDFLPSGKADTIALMLSMSFFWSSQIHLDALVNTIVHNLKPGGNIIFLTIDGDILVDMFEQENTSDMVISSAKIHLYPPQDEPFGQPVDFLLPGSIMETQKGIPQREFVVHLQDFSNKLAPYGIELTLDANALHKAEDDQVLLSEENKLYASMYSYGIYENTDPSILEDFQANNTPTNIDLPIVPLVLFPHIEVPILPPPKRSPPISPQISPPVSPRSQKPTNLPALAVNFAVSSGPAINDDTYVPVTCTWYDDVIRIATIGDGSCFIHSVLKAFYIPYQNNANAKYRIELAKSTRAGLSLKLAEINPEYDLTYWETTAQGSFVSFLMNQLADETLMEESPVNYSLAGMEQLFNSTEYLGDEMYTFVGDMFDIDIIIFRVTTADLHLHEHTLTKDSKRNIICIVGTGCHYEVIGINKPEGFQTIFKIDDPFAQKIYDIIPNKEFISREFDPDTKFINDAIIIFAPHGILNVPSNLQDLFDEADPFIIRWNKLFPEITAKLEEINNTAQNELNYFINEIIRQRSSQEDEDTFISLQDKLIKLIVKDNKEQTLNDILEKATLTDKEQLLVDSYLPYLNPTIAMNELDKLVDNMNFSAVSANNINKIYAILDSYIDIDNEEQTLSDLIDLAIKDKKLSKPLLNIIENNQ